MTVSARIVNKVKGKKGKMQKAAIVQKLHLVLDSSSSKSGNFVCVVEDFYNLLAPPFERNYYRCKYLIS